jgi:hypothetical protein
MTTSYLYKGVTGLFTLSSGTLQLVPISSQFWVPRLIRIGTTLLAPTSNIPVGACQIFHGVISDESSAAFVDGTSNISGDVTGIMNGTLIQPGEAITALWTKMDLDEPAQLFGTYLQILGVSCDNITEATALIATASPGPGFTSPLPNPNRPLPAGGSGLLTVFNNPGPGNSVVLLSASTGQLNQYIYNVTIIPGALTANMDGSLQTVAGANNIAYVNAGIEAGPSIWNFNGFKMTGAGGLQFHQTGSAAANAGAWAVDVVYRQSGF